MEQANDQQLTKLWQTRNNRDQIPAANSTQERKNDRDAAAQPDRTHPGVTYPPARDILTKTSGFIKAYDFTLNPYSGCSFGCSYCYAAFFSRDQAQQDNWGLWVNAKQNAARLLGDLKPGELDGKRIYMSSVTDPYQPLGQRIQLTQQILEKLADRHRPKLVVQTRSPLVTRDIRLFQEIEQRGGRVQVNMTVTTDDEDVRKTFEPGCPSNPARLKAIQQIQKAGIQSCITMMPLLLVGIRTPSATASWQPGCSALSPRHSTSRRASSSPRPGSKPSKSWRRNWAAR